MKIQELACANCGAPLPTQIEPNESIECDNCGSTYILAADSEQHTPVTCPQCSLVNSGSRRSCSGCGEYIQVDCILCHTTNPIDTIYCTNCGANLVRTRGRRERMQAEKRRHQQERSRRLKAKQAQQQVEKLDRLLADLDEPENHDFALYQIRQMGVDAVEALIDTLSNDADPDARYGSARALGQIWGETDTKGLRKAKTVKALVKALQDKEPAVRYWSAEALSKCKSITAIKPLTNLLQDLHSGVRKQARRTLGILGGQEAEAALVEADKRGGILSWVRKPRE